MTGAFDAAQRRQLEAALRQGTRLRCPVCDHELAEQRVEPPAEVAYVRRRVWVLCPACRRTAGLDVRR
jgi:uncharacterized protein with PIN domain